MPLGAKLPMTSMQKALPLATKTAKSSEIPAISGHIHTVAGLFAGIGGLERGLSKAGHHTVLLCENNSAAVAVLEERFPDIRLHDDVTTLKALPKSTTLVVAGFPCQDLSQAGKTVGITGERSGLVDQVFRLIKQQKTPWVLLENVPFMLQLGNGHAMEHICETFESLGYRWAYRVIDSRAFGLPQRRRRVYFLASLHEDPRPILFGDEAGEPDEDESEASNVAYGFYWTEGLRGLGWAKNALPTLKGGSTIGIPSPPAIWMPDGTFVLPDLRDAERMQGFPADWTKPAEKVARASERWKLVGNAVSVNAAEWIGKRLRKPKKLLDLPHTPFFDTKWPSAAWNVTGIREKVAVSEWPQCKPAPDLATYLRFDGKPLSVKATAGFLSRARKGQLRFKKGFLDALDKHLAHQQQEKPKPTRKRKSK